MATRADVYLGASDTAPKLRATLRKPNKVDGTQGDPYDLTGATVTFLIAPKDRSAPAVEGECDVLDQTAFPGVVEYDWGGFDTGAAGAYDARFKAVLAGDAGTVSVPNDRWLTVLVTADPG